MKKYIQTDELYHKMIQRGWMHPDSTVREFIEDDLVTCTIADILAKMWKDLPAATVDDMPPIDPALHAEDPEEGLCYDAADPVLAMLEDGNIVKAVYSIQNGVGFWHEAVALSGTSGNEIKPIRWMPMPPAKLVPK